MCTTSAPEVINGAYGGLPITYEKNTVTKYFVQEEDLYKGDLNGFGSRIGFITNVSSTLFVLYDYYKSLCGEESPECIEILKRLKLCRKAQGDEIDRAKGILTKDFPKHWTNRTKASELDNMTEKEKSVAVFNNSLVTSSRPYFFRYLYRTYNKKYTNYTKSFNTKSVRRFGIELMELLEKKNPSNEELLFINEFREWHPLYDNDSIMNSVCKYMEKAVSTIRPSDNESLEELIPLLKNKHEPTDKELEEIESLLVEYCNCKKELRKKKASDFEYASIEQVCKAIRKKAYEVNSNENDLATIAVTICYEKYKSGSKDFVWNVFSNGVLGNIKMNSTDKIVFPIEDGCGDIDYLGKKYKMIGVDINEDNTG